MNIPILTERMPHSVDDGNAPNINPSFNHCRPVVQRFGDVPRQVDPEAQQALLGDAEALLQNGPSRVRGRAVVHGHDATGWAASLQVPCQASEPHALVANVAALSVLRAQPNVLVKDGDRNSTRAMRTRTFVFFTLVEVTRPFRTGDHAATQRANAEVLQA